MNDIMRLDPVVEKLPMRKTVSIWWKAFLRGEWVWHRESTSYKALLPGDPGYEDARYGICWVVNQKFMNTSK